jgi:hypothetical protein
MEGSNPTLRPSRNRVPTSKVFELLSKRGGISTHMGTSSDEGEETVEMAETAETAPQ